MIPAHDPPRRILVSVPNWVGDAVMATPALRALRTRFADGRIVALMRRYVADALEGLGLADETLFWPDRLVGAGSLLRRLRAERLDLAVLFTNSFRSALVARLGGARRRAGYRREGRGWLLTESLDPPRDGRSFRPIPALDYYNDLAVFVGCGEPSSRMELTTSDADEAAVDARLGALEPGRPLVVLNPGASYGWAKCWPAEYYAEVADALVDRRGARVAASLSPKEAAVADRLRAAARRPIDIFVDPPLGLGPLKALIRRSDLLITNDTGPRHFAPAFDVPVVTVFGSSDPAWTDTRYCGERMVKLGLDCQPCMERTCPLKHHKCMKDLSPQSVLEAAEDLLRARMATRRAEDRPSSGACLRGGSASEDACSPTTAS